MIGIIFLFYFLKKVIGYKDFNKDFIFLFLNSKYLTFYLNFRIFNFYFYYKIRLIQYYV